MSECNARALDINAVWTIQQVEAYLIEAAYTLRRLPDPESGWLHVKAMWVDHQRQQHDNDIDRLPPRIRPSAFELERWERVLNWLTVLDDKADRKVVFWACWSREGHPRCWQAGMVKDRYQWDAEIRPLIRQAGIKEKRGTRTLQRHYRESLKIIAASLTAGALEL